MEAIRRQRSRELLEQVRADRQKRDQATRELAARAIGGCRRCGYPTGAFARCPECGESASEGREALETIIKTKDGWYAGWGWHATAVGGWVFALGLTAAVWWAVDRAGWSWAWVWSWRSAAGREVAMMYTAVTLLMMGWWLERWSRARVRAAFSEPGAVAKAWRLAAWPWVWGAVCQAALWAGILVLRR